LLVAKTKQQSTIESV